MDEKKLQTENFKLRAKNARLAEAVRNSWADWANSYHEAFCKHCEGREIDSLNFQHEPDCVVLLLAEEK